MPSYSAPAAVVLLLAMTLVCGASAITCTDVYSKLYPCLGYFQGGGDKAAPDGSCCGAIKSFAKSAMTGPNGRTACGCLKTAAAGLSGQNSARARGLPAKCGVKLPYAISPSTDCTKVKGRH